MVAQHGGFDVHALSHERCRLPVLLPVRHVAVPCKCPVRVLVPLWVSAMPFLAALAALSMPVLCR